MPSATCPRVVCLGKPEYVGAEYLAEFKTNFNYSEIPAKNRAETQAMLPADIAANGPIDAFIIRMGTPPYEPFDADLLKSLAPNCRIIVSASAGYNEFDVNWMAEQGIVFCNTVNAVAEATADMALFLTLAVLRNTTNAEKSARNGTWRALAGGALVPARDPSGLTLGIVGMGAIGKASKRYLQYLNDNANSCILWLAVPRYQGSLLQYEREVLQPNPIVFCG